MELNFKDLSNGNGIPKKNDEPIPLEQALSIIGTGKYTYFILLAAGMAGFSVLGTILTMTYVVPAADCELHMKPSDKGLLNSVCFFGMIFSSHLFGYLSDNHGRRQVIFVCCLVSGILNLIASLCPDFTSLVVVWFCNGFTIAGIVTPGYVYLSETTPMDSRPRMLLYTTAIGSMAAFVVPALAWFILPLNFKLPLWPGIAFTPWRCLLALSCLLPFLTAAILLQLHESPKYLLAKGHKEETLKTLQTIYRWNSGKSRRDCPISDVILDSGDDMSVKNTGNSCYFFFNSMWSQTKDLFTFPLLPYTLISCALQFGIIGGYNVIMLWLPDLINRMSQLPGLNVCDAIRTHSIRSLKEPLVTIDFPVADLNSTYYDALPGPAACASEINQLVFMISLSIGVAQVIMFFLISGLPNLVGRQRLLVILSIIPAFAIIGVTMVNDLLWTSLLLGSAAVVLSSALPITINIIVELFPTYIRTMATSICTSFGRIGALLGSQLYGYLQVPHCELAYYLLAALLVVTSILGAIAPMKPPSK